MIVFSFANNIVLPFVPSSLQLAFLFVISLFSVRGAPSHNSGWIKDTGCPTDLSAFLRNGNSPNVCDPLSDGTLTSLIYYVREREREIEVDG